MVDGDTFRGALFFSLGLLAAHSAFWFKFHTGTRCTLPFFKRYLVIDESQELEEFDLFFFLHAIYSLWAPLEPSSVAERLCDWRERERERERGFQSSIFLLHAVKCPFKLIVIVLQFRNSGRKMLFRWPCGKQVLRTPRP